MPYTPNLIRTRPYNFILGLLRRGNTLTLATLWENEAERDALHKLEETGIQVIASRLTKVRSASNSIRALLTQTPLQAVYCWQPELIRLLETQIQSHRFDAIHIEHLRGAHYGLWLKARLLKSASCPVFVWDSVDCISHLFEQAAHGSRRLISRLITRLELNRTQRYEGWLVGQFDRVVVTSPVDQLALEQLALRANGSASTIKVVPNGVDLSFFAPRDQAREAATIVFSGKMSYHANVTAALYLLDEIMPLIWAHRPSVRVQIVGKDPPASIRQLAARFPNQVTVTGTVPDIRPYLAHATVAVSPMKYGAGIQNKVLEAMAMATPVVVTPQAVAALQTRADANILIGATPQDFATQVLRTLDSPDRQARIGRGGRQYVEQHHDWARVVEQLEMQYRTNAESAL
ncbi:MAG: glycosyltransferase [Chloroflexi bacterium]|nr:glycosyltransferase [Chloroflexota bacterium]